GAAASGARVASAPSVASATLTAVSSMPRGAKIRSCRKSPCGRAAPAKTRLIEGSFLCRLGLARGLRDGFHLREAFLEHAADHGVHAHEHADGFGHEMLPAEHGPRDHGLIALGPEGELRGLGPRERLHG